MNVFDRARLTTSFRPSSPSTQFHFRRGANASPIFRHNNNATRQLSELNPLFITLPRQLLPIRHSLLLSIDLIVVLGVRETRAAAAAVGAFAASSIVGTGTDRRLLADSDAGSVRDAHSPSRDVPSEAIE
jgi:hypothetical protein